MDRHGHIHVNITGQIDTHTNETHTHTHGLSIDMICLFLLIISCMQSYKQPKQVMYVYIHTLYGSLPKSADSEWCLTLQMHYAGLSPSRTTTWCHRFILLETRFWCIMYMHCYITVDVEHNAWIWAVRKWMPNYYCTYITFLKRPVTLQSLCCIMSYPLHR
jgi:hypothetical protein